MSKRAIITIAAILGFSTAATAAESSTIGKLTSRYTKTDFLNLPAGTTPSASAPLPEKYSSKKNFLTITTMVQEECTGDVGGSTLKIGGVSLHPDPSTLNYADCWDSNGYEMVTRTWMLVPESLGGPAIPDGSTIDLSLYSQTGGVSVGLIAIHAVASK